MSSFCANRSNQSTTCLLPRKAQDHDASLAFAPIIASRSIRGDHKFGSTLAERRSCSQPPRLLLASKKRSIRSVASELALDGQCPYSRYSLSLPLAKRIKEPLTAPSTIDLPLDDGEKIPNHLISQKPSQLSDDETTLSEHRVADGHKIEPNHSKALLSPINLNAQIVKYRLDSTTTESIEPPNGSEYHYYPPTNPSDGHATFAQWHGTGPRRQLSYGEPINHSKPRSLHKSTGSTELRREAGWSLEYNNCGSWFDDESIAPAIKPWYSEPPRPKPRLWLDLAEDGGQIEEAHSTTVTTSPSKARVISIPRRCTTTPQSTSPTSIEEGSEKDGSIVYPQTPLQPSIGLGICSLETPTHSKETLAYNRIKARAKWTTMTPPSTPFSTPFSTSTLRPTPMIRPGTPRPPTSTMPQLSELTTWILSELERSLTSPAKIQLDNLVIQQIRLPVSQRRIPRTPPSLPLSRYSTFKGPLGSHPTPPPNTPASSSCHSLERGLPPFQFPISTTDYTLKALQSIFPQTSLDQLSCLQATSLALHYVRSIHLPSYSSTPQHQTPTPILKGNESEGVHYIQTELDITHVPSKARAMLGLPAPTSRPALPKDWLFPKAVSWAERIEALKERLGKEVGVLVWEFVGSRAGRGMGREREMEEALVKAVGEIVRMGEEVRR